jgi:exo-1,4-beta-D-glucosaminidase
LVNSRYEPVRNLKISAKVYDFDLHERSSQEATVPVEADGKAEAFKLALPDGLSTTYFLVLQLTDGADKLITDNFYWLSTVPDTPGEVHEGRRDFSIEPKSTADLKQLNALQPVRLAIKWTTKDTGLDTIIEAAVENPAKQLAFQVRLAITQGKGGPEVCPTFWSENYFSLLPGERKTMTATVHTEDLGGAAPAVHVDGWNVTGTD